jgi:hypothetical protein
MEFAEMYFASYQGQPQTGPTLASGSRQLDKAHREQIEDKVRQAIDGWTEEEQATAYWYLYASGMNLEKAKAIRARLVLFLNAYILPLRGGCSQARVAR